MVIIEPVPDRTGPLCTLSKEMGSDRQWNVWIQKMSHVVNSGPWPNLMAVYYVYTLQTRLL